MTTCPHSDRCVCIGACKHGFAGNGASEFSPASTRRATAVGKHARGVLSGLQRGPDTATERHWQARVDALDAAIAALQAALPNVTGHARECHEKLRDELYAMSLRQDLPIDVCSALNAAGVTINEMLVSSALSAEPEPEGQECDHCGGVGTVDETLGGYALASQAAECPDCRGTGVLPAATTSAEPRGVEAGVDTPLSAEPVAWGLVRDGKLRGLGMERDADAGLVHPLYLSPVAGGAVAGLVAKWRQSAADYRRDAESRYEDDDARAWLLDLAIADEKRADELERALAVTAPDSTQPLLSAQGAGVSNAADSTGRRETCQSCGGDDVGGHDEMCARDMPKLPAAPDSTGRDAVDDGGPYNGIDWPATMREALRLCYVELFHCAQQLQDAGYSVKDGGSVRTALAAGKAALDASPTDSTSGEDDDEPGCSWCGYPRSANPLAHDPRCRVRTHPHSEVARTELGGDAAPQEGA